MVDQATPLFILGYPKSGTTLINSLLDDHPELNVISQESDYFGGIYFTVNRLMKSNKLSNTQKIKLLLSKFIKSTHLSNFYKGKVTDDPRGNFDYSNFNLNLFEQGFKDYLQGKEINHKNVLNAVAHAYKLGASKNGSYAFWVEKTPCRLLNVTNRKQLLDEIFADYKVIHIIRDPRDNYIAYQKKNPKLSVYDICVEWKRVVNSALNFSKEKSLIIRYEDLVLENSITIDRIVQFLGISYHSSLLRPTKNGYPWYGNSMFDGKTEGISSGRIKRYLRYNDQEKIKLIECLCEEEMRRLNYLKDKGSIHKSFSIKQRLAEIRLNKKIFRLLSKKFLGNYWKY